MIETIDMAYLKTCIDTFLSHVARPSAWRSKVGCFTQNERTQRGDCWRIDTFPVKLIIPKKRILQQ